MKLIILNTVLILLWCGVLSDRLRELILFCTYRAMRLTGVKMEKS
jgi:hypothetical protein